MATYNGVDIIPLPSTFALKQIELVAVDAVAVSTSPYTQTQMVQEWVGASMWTGSLALPSLNAHDARAIEAFLYALRGAKNVFQIGHPLRSHPRGNPKGTPVTDGAALAMATTVTTRGWQAGIAQLMPGDHIQIGLRLHVCLDAFAADANGKASFSIWPSLREDVADGTPIAYFNAKGLFRLADNKRSVSTSESRLSAVQTLKIVEAR